MRTNPEEMSRPGECAQHSRGHTTPTKRTGKRQAAGGARGPPVASALLPRGLSLKRVGHEASVGSLGDKGMPRSHNLKAQKAEGTEQGGCGGEECQPRPPTCPPAPLPAAAVLRGTRGLPGSPCPRPPTSVLTVLVEADEDIVGVELLLSKLEKNCETEGHLLGPRPGPHGHRLRQAASLWQLSWALRGWAVSYDITPTPPPCQ